ncbi:MAG: hypothetical protein IH957_10545 [Chloroflexi bacterium]|nr:hypothetical protein [Chloroflexota bacterium]
MSAEANPRWERVGFADLPGPFIDTGCPLAPALAGASPDDWIDGFYNGAYPKIEGGQPPSPYVHHVYVMDSSTLDRLLVGTDARVHPQEFECGGDACREVTSAIYLTEPEARGDVEFVAEIVEQALGLRVRPE